MQPALSPILCTARDILRTAKFQAMHVDDIAGAAVAKNLNLGMPVEAFSRKLQGALAANLKLKTQKPTFAKVEGKKGTFRRGWYRLKQERSQSPTAKVAPPAVTTDFIGKAGEHAVMGELLFWGYNVSLMSVDNGVDVVAQKNNRYFHVQVKTATEQAGRKFTFSIKKQAFEANDNSSMFYVFVMRRRLSNDFAIVPSSHIQTLLAAGAVGAGKVLSVTITPDEKGHRYELNGTDISIFINNFAVIR